MNELVLQSWCGPISVISPNNFRKVISQFATTKVNEHVRVLEKSPFTDAWGDDLNSSIASATVSTKMHELKPLGRDKLPDNEHFLIELFLAEVFKLIDAVGDNLIVSDTIDIKVITEVSKKFSSIGGSSQHLNFFTWRLSSFRMISMLYDSYSIKIYRNDVGNRAAIYINPKDIVLVYTNGDSYTVNESLYDMQKYHYRGPSIDPRVEMFDEEYKRKLQRKLRDEEVW